MEKKNFWKNASVFVRAFLILAFVFLVLGLGTLGSVVTTGDSFVLQKREPSDDKEPGIVLTLNDPGHGEEEHEHRDLYVREVYVNIGAIYTEPGKVAKLSIARGTTSSSPYTTHSDISFANFYEDVEEGGTSVEPNEGALFNWIKYTVPSTDGWRLSTYSFYKLVAVDCNLMINEIVFVGTDAENTEEPVVLQAAVHETSILPTDSELTAGDRDKAKAAVLEQAKAVIDSQRIPAMTQSSFFRFGEEEAVTLLTISEMDRGSANGTGEVYNLEHVYNALGVDLVALGTAIFGISPFGLRIMPFLAAFGTLVLGFFLVKKLFGSEKAAFVFSLLFALSGIGFTLGHFGTPLMIGVFFLTGALYFAFCYFRDGVEHTGVRGAVRPIAAGLFSAAAICVNGAYVVPLVAVAGLYVAGIVRMVSARRAALDTAIEEAEEEEKHPVALEEGEEEHPGARAKVAATLAEYRFKAVVVPTLFFAILILGTFLIEILSALPLYYVYVKLYDTPAAPANSIFYFLWRAFAGGFSGVNAGTVQSAWEDVYVLFRGVGENAAVTATGVLPMVAVIVAMYVGLIYRLISTIRNFKREGGHAQLIETLVPLFFLCVFFITAEIVKWGGLAFLVLAYLLFFGFAGDAVERGGQLEGKPALAARIVTYVLLFAVAVCFGLFAIYTFSIPAAGFLPV